MLHKSDGCYHKEYGWTGKKDDVPDILETALPASEGNDDDFQIVRGWQSLLKHNDAVTGQLKKIASSCGLNEKHQKDIIQAARWHDAGKAHEIFQEAMVGDPPEADPSVIWGKTARTAIAYRRKGFRHELASALAMLESGLPDLAVFLAAAHHGKVRLSIRSLAHEKRPDDPEIRFARGIWEGDVLRTTDLGDDHRMPETRLDLSYMEFGEGSKGASWLARMLALRDDPSLGPFRLAFFEALLRTADWRASEKAESNDE
jgi:CRISPR-associated endonuclease/helicase Cas3